jgi:hypothetical protein
MGPPVTPHGEPVRRTHHEPVISLIDKRYGLWTWDMGQGVIGRIGRWLGAPSGCPRPAPPALFTQCHPYEVMQWPARTLAAVGR